MLRFTSTLIASIILLCVLLAGCTADNPSPANTSIPTPSPTTAPTQQPAETPGIAARLEASLADFVPPTPLPEYTPEQTVFAGGYYTDEIIEYGNRVFVPTLEDAEGNELALPPGTKSIERDDQWPVDSGSIVSLELPRWAIEAFSRWDDELGYRVSPLELGCYMLTNGDKAAIMRLDGELVTGFDYGYTTSVYGAQMFSYKGYVCISGMYDNTQSPNPNVYRHYNYALVDIRTGREILPQVYIQMDLYDGYIYAADDHGGHFIFDYEGNVLMDLSEYHQSLKDWMFPLDTLMACE